MCTFAVGARIFAVYLYVHICIQRYRGFFPSTPRRRDHWILPTSEPCRRWAPTVGRVPPPETMSAKRPISLIRNFHGTPLRPVPVSTLPCLVLAPTASDAAEIAAADDQSSHSGCEDEGGMASVDSITEEDSLSIKVSSCKRAWSPEEDEILMAAVHSIGASHWSRISSHLPGRVGKQCRERWCNHLCPMVTKGVWTQDEDAIIAQGVAELGIRTIRIYPRLVTLATHRIP